MEIIAAVRIVRAALGLLAIWALFYVSIRSYLLDDLRQALFEIRDDLFDMAAEGGAISFDDPSYKSLRHDLNSLIFFADKISFMRIALTPVSEQATQLQEEWAKNVEHLPPLVRRTLLAMRQRALERAMRYVVRRSIFLTLVDLIVRLAALWIGAARTLLRLLPAFADRLEAQALNEKLAA
jgi:hypothetical protein